MFLLRYLRHMEFQKKTGRYILYAIGEIVLVVVGILIALQINNWNEGRKQEQQRRDLIENLKSDFETNLRRLDEIIEIARDVEEGLETFLRIAVGDTKDFSIGELQVLALNAWTAVVFQPSLGSYQTALSTGSFGLLEDTRLSELFTDFVDRYALFKTHQELNLQMQFLGEVADLRKKLGSIRVLYESAQFAPETYFLKDQEYRDLIAQKDVYALFESKHEIRRRQHAQLLYLKEKTDEILAQLEAL
jgi:hypothetical protein